jgi:hypothetical protein
MNKIICILAIMSIAIMTISGCVDKDPLKEIVLSKLPPLAPQPAASSAPDNGTQEEAIPIEEPMLSITGQVALDQSTISTASPEYSIELAIQNTAQDPLTFDKIVVKYDDRFEGKSVILNIYPTTLAHGQTMKQNVRTYGLKDMQENAEWSTGKKNVKMHIYLRNGGADVSEDYMDTLPSLPDMQDGQNFQLNFTKK